MRLPFAALFLLSTAALAGPVRFYQEVDRPEVRPGETLRLVIVTVNAPDDSELRLPELEGFQVLTTAPSYRASIRIDENGVNVERIRKRTLRLRPTRSGLLTIPAAELQAGERTWRTEPLQVVVAPLPDEPRAPRTFGAPPPVAQLPEEPARRSPDVVIQTQVDRASVYVGEQVTVSTYVYTRSELVSVAGVSLPSGSGFWSEDLARPTELVAESRTLDGVTYDAYLVKRTALFPTRPGRVRLAPAEADVTTARGRVHRSGNTVDVVARALPPGAPAGFSSANVGEWQLSVEGAPPTVRLGETFTLRVSLSGRGNVKNVTPPALEAPPSFRVLAPTTSDRISSRQRALGGRRAQEYVVVPTQTGAFALPALSFAYFDPRRGRYEIARSEPIRIAVEAAPVAVAASTAAAEPAEPARNVLRSDGMRPLRLAAQLDASIDPPWARGWYVPAVLSPLALWLAMGAFGLVRQRASREDPNSLRGRQARQARRRLGALRSRPAGPELFAEIERAVLQFAEARAGAPLGGLTREAMEQVLAERGVSPRARALVIAVLAACEQARYAPAFAIGAGADADPRRLIAEAEAAFDAFDAC